MTHAVPKEKVMEIFREDVREITFAEACKPLPASPTWVMVRWLVAADKLHGVIFGRKVDPVVCRNGEHHALRSLWSHVFSFWAARKLFRYHEVFDEARAYAFEHRAKLAQAWTPELDHEVRIEFANRLERQAKALGRWGVRPEKDEEYYQARHRMWEVEAVLHGVCPVCGLSGPGGHVPPCHGYGGTKVDFTTSGPKIVRSA
jgi:hypothetical protein